MMNKEEHGEPDYEKAELDLLRESLKKTHEERFLTMTKLMKRNIMLKNAKVVHKPLSATNKKAVNPPKDQVDITNLERIEQLLQEEENKAGNQL